MRKSGGRYKFVTVYLHSISQALNPHAELMSVFPQRICLKPVQLMHPCRNPEFSHRLFFRIRLDVQNRSVVPCIQAFHPKPGAAPLEELYYRHANRIRSVRCPRCQKAELWQFLEALGMNQHFRLSCLMQPKQYHDVRKALDSLKPFCPALVNLNCIAAHPADWMKRKPMPHAQNVTS